MWRCSLKITVKYEENILATYTVDYEDDILLTKCHLHTLVPNLQPELF